jgi:SNF2-related domain
MHSICSGGLLADAMGLGKTLTMLSAIVASRDGAAAFQAETPPLGEVPHAKATLIVATSRRMRERTPILRQAWAADAAVYHRGSRCLGLRD